MADSQSSKQLLLFEDQPVKRSRGYRLHLTWEERRQIKRDYDAGETMSSLARRYDCSGVAIGKIIERQKLGPAVPKRTYTLDEDYFAAPTTLEQAWVAGFLAGDGCIRPDGVATVAIHARDIDALEKIRVAVGTDSPIKTFAGKSKNGKEFPGVRLDICSRRFTDHLIALGVRPRKTFTLNHWHGPAHLDHGFYLGLIDADGFWIKSPQKAGPLIWSHGLVGTKEICEGYARLIRSRTGADAVVKPHFSIFKVRYSGLALIKAIAGTLYADCPVWLNRKRATVEELLAYEPRHRDWSRYSKAELLYLRTIHPTWTAVAAYLGTSPSNLAQALRRRGIGPDVGLYDHITKEDLESDYARLGSWAAVARERGIKSNFSRLCKQKGVSIRRLRREASQ